MKLSTIEQSPLFQRWTDPLSGVESFILSQGAAPFQQSFYYTNPSLTNDGRFLWIYCAYPPSGSANQGRCLAVADLHTQEFCVFPETQFLDASPCVDLNTGYAYWCIGTEIWKRGPLPAQEPELVNRLPESLTHHRRPWRVATHLTFSADHKSLNIDAEIGRQWFVGHAPLDGSDVMIWQELDRAYNHGQFSPVDPDLQLINQDSAIDPVTGVCPPYENRMWLIRRGEKASPIFPTGPKHGHEWWSANGQHVWYIHYNRGVERVRIDTPNNDPELMWTSDTVSHAHVDATERYIVADCVPGRDTGIGKVIFYNTTTRRELSIVSDMPYPSEALRRYHVHPHPQFCRQDEYICYTTLVRGKVEVALVPVADLISRTT